MNAQDVFDFSKDNLSKAKEMIQTSIIAKLDEIDQLKEIDFSSLPNIFGLFNQPPSVSLVVGTHLNLFTSDNLVTGGSEPKIKTVVYQKIGEGKGINVGKIASHQHSDVHEIIITKGEPGYPGLPDPTAQVDGYMITFVPAGVEHGSDVESASGEWISIKIAIA